MTNPVGRPLKFTSPEQLQIRIDEYFAKCEAMGKAISITGLAIHLDTYRSTLCNYEVQPEFMDTIKKAKQRVENFYEERLTLPNVAGVVFALKNFDWTDKQDINHGGQPGGVPIATTAKPTEEQMESIKQYVLMKGTQSADNNPAV